MYRETKCLIAAMMTCILVQAQTEHGRSPIAEPYPYVTGGSFQGPPVKHSPDPLVSYRWPAPQANDGLEIYTRKPVAISADPSASFDNIQSMTGHDPMVTVLGAGSIRIDFEVEHAAWIEFDSPDLSGEVEMSISEYNQPNLFPVKTAVPRKYGNTYRLELNAELYEGVRFGWIHVRSFERPWHITGLRLVCQIKPTNYNGSFACSDTLLTRIWYTGAYTVKLNLLKDYFGAILMDRSDRISWTGDAYPAQAASMVAFANYDFVKKNLVSTERESNGIRSYTLYWILSLMDYYRYTADAALLTTYLKAACDKLDDAYKVYGTDPELTFFGWDERLGAGFEHPNLTEPQNAYKMLSIRAWKEFSEIMGQIGRTDLRDKYGRYAQEKINALRKDTKWYMHFGLHAAADAINTGLLTEPEKKALYQANFTDRATRLSYSPFNQYFIIQALSVLERNDGALSAIRDLWGGQLRYGGTTFFEDYRPSWNDVVSLNGPVPNNQCGFTSLCHPWGAGVTKWLSEEILGIKPTAPGFATYDVIPHLGGTLTDVSGKMPTPAGDIQAAFDISSGICRVVSPAGTVGRVGIPKARRNIARMTVNGALLWDGAYHAVAGMKNLTHDGEFIYLNGLQPGEYSIVVTYKGRAPVFPEDTTAYRYPAHYAGMDSTTQGNWGGKYGRAGYVLCNYLGDGNDKSALPDYVSAISYYKKFGEDEKPQHAVWETNTLDQRALAADKTNQGPRTAACLYAHGPDQIAYTFTLTVDVKNKHPYQVSLYFVDWDDKGRQMAIEMFDAQTQNLIAPVKITPHCTGGAYITYTYDRSATFRIDLVRGVNPVLSGIFFDEPMSLSRKHK